MIPGSTISTILGAGTLVLGVLYSTALWQRKEYRMDRMMSHLRSPEGFLFHDAFILCALISTVFGWVAYINGHILYLTILGLISLISLASYHLCRTYLQGIHRPDMTLKASLVVTGTFVGIFSFLFIVYSQVKAISLLWATAILFIPLFSSIAVLAVNILAGIRKKSTIRDASRLRDKIDIVVGITGSVGKTSTKHFLFHLLDGSKYEVYSTKEHRNSEYSVAVDVLERFAGYKHTSLRKKILYIVEMGAYREGEIDDIVKLVRPTYGIVTSITNQHLSLFGSRQAIARAKWELVNGIRKNGAVVLNADDEKISEMSRGVSGKIMWYGTSKKADIRASNITVSPGTITLILHIQHESYPLELPIVGTGAMYCVLAAVAYAKALGISDQVVIKKLRTITPFPRTMAEYKSPTGIVVVDDSYSASESAVLNALHYIRVYEKALKRVIFVPIIELGCEAHSVHERIGKTFAHVADEVYIYGTSYKSDIIRGVNKGERRIIMRWYKNPRRLAHDACQNLDASSVVLLEGRVPQSVREAVLQHM